MFKFYLLYNPKLKRYKMLTNHCSAILIYYFVVLFCIQIFGNMLLQFYFKKNTELHIAWIDSIPLIIKIFIIHFSWIYVIIFICMILSLIFTPNFAKPKHYDIDRIVLDIRLQRWRWWGLIYASILFGFFGFLMFVFVFNQYAFGLAFGLFLLYEVLCIMFVKNIVLTKNGVLIKRILSNVFIPYKYLITISDKDMQDAIKNSLIRINYKDDFMDFRHISKDGLTVRESFMKLYNELVAQAMDKNEQ